MHWSVSLFSLSPSPKHMLYFSGHVPMRPTLRLRSVSCCFRGIFFRAGNVRVRLDDSARRTSPMSTTVRTRLSDLERTPGWSSFVSVPARTWNLWGLLFVKYGPTLSQVCPWPIVYVGHKSVREKLLGFKLIGPNGNVSHALSIIIIDDFLVLGILVCGH